ncbi:MAG: ArsR family transcriptional regulator [Chloroflexi bacterium]|nr:ArsR family transcriptional regulator [Chloroflexota bacterium]
MDGTRPQILDFLLRQRTATVEDMAASFNLAPATLRRHLDILQRDNLVAYQRVRRKAGRPEYAYFLTEEGMDRLPKSYGRLLATLMQEIGAMTAEDVAGHDGRQILEMVCRRVGERLVERHAGRVNGKGFEGQLAELVRILSEEDFYPELDWASPDRLRIRLMNCPYRCAAQGNHAVCCADMALIKNVLHTDVEREQCLADGSPSCSYLVTIKPSLSPLPQDSAPHF